MAQQSLQHEPSIQAVALYPTRRLPEHELASHAAVARQLAALHDAPFAGLYDPGYAPAGRTYYVPTGTLVACEDLRRLDITHSAHLFGGYVPHPFVATKAITHALVHSGANAPAGWSERFAERVAHATLPGWTAFSEADAFTACERLWQEGPVRVKEVNATAGRGQTVVHNRSALREALAGIAPEELALCGVVLEMNLDDVTTFSVGQVTVAGLAASYVGTQRLVQDNGGAWVYGGSRLNVVRGDFDTLLQCDLNDRERTAIGQAQCYDTAANECFPGFFASRRNYDMVVGVDVQGNARSGVLEQSWRIGGASGAELAALTAFRAQPSLARITAATYESYGASPEVPQAASVVYWGDDSECGPMVKYVVVEDL